MPIQVSLEKDHIQLLSSGDQNKEEIRTAIREIDALTEKSGFHRLFVDASKETSILKPIELFGMAQEVRPNYKVAYFANEKLYSSTLLNLVQGLFLTSRSHSLVFYDRDEAMKWLLSDQ